MSLSKFAALAGIAAVFVAGCTSPEPQVTRATPLYSKSGEALCVEDSIYDPNETYDRPICEDVCEEDPSTAGNVAICPPYYDGQRGDENEDPGGRSANAAGP